MRPEIDVRSPGVEADLQVRLSGGGQVSPGRPEGGLLRPSAHPGRVVRRGWSPALVALVSAVALAGCRQDMHDAPRYDPLEASAFFADGQSARQLVPNTVARGQLREDRHLFEGVVDDQPAMTFPMPVTQAVMLRGQNRYEIFCSPCHGSTGEGNGMIVQRGFRQPPSYHEERLREAPVGYFFDVITHGFGAMQDYSSQLPVEDRWAVAAYIRALQLSQGATPADLPPDGIAALGGAADAAAGQQAAREVR